jgi:phenylacetate-CoA ligase
VRHAYTHVALYRAKCEAVGAHPDDLRDLTDLARFPFTVKDDLRRAPTRSAGRSPSCSTG